MSIRLFIVIIIVIIGVLLGSYLQQLDSRLLIVLGTTTIEIHTWFAFFALFALGCVLSVLLSFKTTLINTGKSIKSAYLHKKNMRLFETLQQVFVAQFHQNESAQAEHCKQLVKELKTIQPDAKRSGLIAQLLQLALLSNNRTQAEQWFSEWHEQPQHERNRLTSTYRASLLHFVRVWETLPAAVQIQKAQKGHTQEQVFDECFLQLLKDLPKRGTCSAYVATQIAEYALKHNKTHDLLEHTSVLLGALTARVHLHTQLKMALCLAWCDTHLDKHRTKASKPDNKSVPACLKSLPQVLLNDSEAVFAIVERWLAKYPEAKPAVCAWLLYLSKKRTPPQPFADLLLQYATLAQNSKDLLVLQEAVASLTQPVPQELLRTMIKTSARLGFLELVNDYQKLLDAQKL